MSNKVSFTGISTFFQLTSLAFTLNGTDARADAATATAALDEVSTVFETESRIPS